MLFCGSWNTVGSHPLWARGLELGLLVFWVSALTTQLLKLGFRNAVLRSLMHDGQRFLASCMFLTFIYRYTSRMGIEMLPCICLVSA